MEIPAPYPFNPEEDKLGNGALTAWVKRRHDFGEHVTILHPQASLTGDNEHAVAWLYRNFMDFDTGETHSYFQVACDCMAHKTPPNIPFLEFLYCEDMAHALILRAHQISGFIVSEPKEQIIQDATGQAILDVLSLEKEKPHIWLANMLSGEHETTMLSIILNKNADEVVDCAYELAEYGLLELDGTNVKLAA